MLAEVTLKAYLKSGSNWVINKPPHSRFEFGRDFWVDCRIFWDDLFGGFQQKGENGFNWSLGERTAPPLNSAPKQTRSYFFMAHLDPIVTFHPWTGFLVHSLIPTWKIFQSTLTFSKLYILLKTNVAPENGPSQKEIHLPTIDLKGLC